MVEGTFQQGVFRCQLEKLGDGWWRFHTHQQGGAITFDFERKLASGRLLDRQSCWLQQAQESPFVQNAVCQHITLERLVSLRGRVRLESTGEGTSKSLLADELEYRAALQRDFGLELEDESITTLWQRIQTRHQELFPELFPEGVRPHAHEASAPRRS